LDNKYGYKVCYKEFGKNKLRIHMICNTKSLAEWEIQYYDSFKLFDKKINKLIINPIWYIIPIKTYFEYKKLLRGCPF